MPQVTELETELGTVRWSLSRSEQGVSSPFGGVPMVLVPRAVFSTVVGLVGGKKEKKQWFLHRLEHLLGARQRTERFLEIIASHHQNKPLGYRKCHPPVTGGCQGSEKKAGNLPKPLLDPKSTWTKALTVMTVRTASWPLVADRRVGERTPGRDALEETLVLGAGLDQAASSQSLCVSFQGAFLRR